MASLVETPEHLQLPHLPEELKEQSENHSHPSDERPHQPICIIFDFDETLTSSDTIDLLAQASCQNNHHGHGEQCPIWQQILQRYGDDALRFEQQCNGTHIAKHMRTNVDLELEYQRRKDDIEQASLERVGESGMFKSFTREQIRTAAEFYITIGKIQLREGLRDLIDAVKSRHKHSCVGIVSVNWSKDFIWAVMELSGYGQIATMANSIDPANGFIWGSDGQITPTECIPLANGVHNRLQVAQDKLWAMRPLIQPGLKADQCGSDGTWHTLVYIGDSLTDLACMQHADIPIIMLKNKNILRDFRRMGIMPYHISSFSSSSQAHPGKLSVNVAKKFYWATNFSEIVQTELFLSKNDMAAQIYPDTDISVKDWYARIGRYYAEFFSQEEYDQEMKHEKRMDAEEELRLQENEEGKRVYREHRAQNPMQERHRISEMERQKRSQDIETTLAKLGAKGDATTEGEREIFEMYEQMDDGDSNDADDDLSYDSPEEGEDIWQPMAMSAPVADQVALSQIAGDDSQKKEAEQYLFSMDVLEPLMSGCLDEADEGMMYLALETAGENVSDIANPVEDDWIQDYDRDGSAYAGAPHATTYLTSLLDVIMEEDIDLLAEDQNADQNANSNYVEETDWFADAPHADANAGKEGDTVIEGLADVNCDNKGDAGAADEYEKRDISMAMESPGYASSKQTDGRQWQGGR